MKMTFFTLIFMLSSLAFAQTQPFQVEEESWPSGTQFVSVYLDEDGFLREASTNALHKMTAYWAHKACPVGTHIPTIREWAVDATLRGAAGILEVSQVTDPHIAYNAGYRLVTSLKVNVVTPDEFWFKTEGFNQLFIQDVAWSHGRFHASSTNKIGSIWFMNNHGNISLNYDGEEDVRCIQD